MNSMKISKDFIYLGIILLMGLMGYLFLYQPLDKLKYKHDIEVVKKEEIIKEFKRQLILKDSIFNVVERERDSVLFTIENRKENIKYIYKNYDKKIKDINNLSTDSTISYFKTWIKK